MVSLRTQCERIADERRTEVPRRERMPPRFDVKSEWIETDGLGGFASGTVSGIRTRRYHALLLAATTPPTGRFVLVNGLESWVESPAGRFALSSHLYEPHVVHPDGVDRDRRAGYWDARACPSP